MQTELFSDLPISHVYPLLAAYLLYYFLIQVVLV